MKLESINFKIQDFNYVGTFTIVKNNCDSLNLDFLKNQSNFFDYFTSVIHGRKL